MTRHRRFVRCVAALGIVALLLGALLPALSSLPF